MKPCLSCRGWLLAATLGGAVCSAAVLAGPARGADSAAYRSAAAPIVADLNKHSAQAFTNSLDRDAIIGKALDPLGAELKDASAFRTGLARGIERVGPQIAGAMPKDGYAKLLRVRTKDGEGHCLVRLGYGDSGYGYMDWAMRADRDGRLRIVDWFDYSTGQNYTDSLRTLSVLVAPNPSLLGKLFDIASGKAERTRQVIPMMQALGKQEFARAYEVFDKLDEELKRNRTLSVAAVGAANRSQNEAHYRAALANLDKHHGSEPALVFLLIDHYVMTKQYDRLLHAIDAFQKFVGVEDAALAGIKANSYMMSGKPDQAIAAAIEGIRIEPELAANYWTLLASYNRTGRYDKVVDTAALLRRQFGLALGPAEFEKDADYKEFVRSAAFRRWKRKG